MYRVVIQKDEPGYSPENLIADTLEEVGIIIDKAKENNYDMLLVEKMEARYAKEFIEELTVKLPEDLATGVIEKKESNDNS